MEGGIRKLAAIMFTDMVGFTSLAQEDEALSLSLLERERRLVRPIILQYHGLEIKALGDGLLVEFPNVLDAVTCAHSIQAAVRGYNDGAPPDERVHLRIGIHLGDVIEADGDVYGDAVNVASRIEALAEDDGVCITRQVFDHVWNKSEVKFESIGHRNLKHVVQPVEVFRMSYPWVRTGQSGSSQSKTLDPRRIAVMPFANMSPDPGDSYFADGITDEIISTLSNVDGLSVISRTSVMGYRNTTKKVTEIGRELGVGSVLEGSFRKAGSRIRVTTQLINASDDGHVWAQNYDRELSDVFAVQTEIAEKVAATLKAKLFTEDAKLLQRASTSNPEAYNLYLKGRHLLTEGSDASIKRALEHFNRAIGLDPRFAKAYIGLGECHADLAYRSYISFDEGVAGIRSAASKALEIEQDLAEGHYLLALAAWFLDERHTDELEARRAIELNPNLSQAHQMLGVVEACAGYPRQAIRHLETAYSLDPLDSRVITYLGRMYAYLGPEERFNGFVDANSAVTPFPISLVKMEYYLDKKDLDGAEREMNSLQARAPDDFRVLCYKAKFYALRGDREGTDRTVNLLVNRFGEGATLVRHLGIIKYYLGDVNGFFADMEIAAREHVIDPAILLYSRAFEKARKDPRMKRVMEIAKLEGEVKE